MKRVLLFLFFASIGTATVVHLAGGVSGPPAAVHDAELPRAPGRPAGVPTLSPGGPIDIERASAITQMAPPTRIVWKDPLSDETITIENFQAWRCVADEVEPLVVTGEEGQAALLTNVIFEIYREPASRTEALALRDGTGNARYAALLHQRFEAEVARVFGRLGQAMASRRSGNAENRDLGDTRLELARNLVIHEFGQGIVIRGTEDTQLTVYPEGDHAKGKGPFTVTHEALVLTGTGLSMDRDQERGYGRVEILKNPTLRIISAGTRKDGRPIFDFGEGDFRPTTVTSKETAVLERQESRRETVITVNFRKEVHATQVGGRSLTAGHATLVALRGTGPRLDTGGWRLRSFHADDGVEIQYPGLTRKSEAFLATIRAGSLHYEVPDDGREATTVFERNVIIEMRGELALLGPKGHLRATCRDRASIGPLPAEAPDGGLERALLRLITLRGQARIERSLNSDSLERDFLEADAIDLVAWPRKRGSGRATGEAAAASTRMIAVHFAAVGHVTLESLRMRGDTTRIVADDLHRPHPHIVAEGKGTTFTLRQLARNQGLLGPDTRGSTGAPEEAEPSADERGSWTLNRIVAGGAVDINTTLGGPSLGISAHLEGDELTYDGLSLIARVRSLKGKPVLLTWSATATKTNQIETREITFDRAAGRVTATGGFEGAFYLVRGTKQSPLPRRKTLGFNQAGTELTVRTDKRIDITLARQGEDNAPMPGAEQRIRIVGPVTTELRSSSGTIDRMRSNSLQVTLSYRLTEDEGNHPVAIPLARTSGHSNTPPAATTTPDMPPANPTTVEPIHVTAGSVRLDLAGGEVSYLEANGGVELKGRESHLTGQRLTFDGLRHRVEVFAGATPARALLGASARGQHSEVQARRMVVDFLDGRLTRLEAHTRAGGTNDIHLYRAVKGTSGAAEWYALTYQDQIVMTDTQLTTQRVRVIRRVRKKGSKLFGDPAVLRAPRLVATGRQMLANDDGVRHIARIEAIEEGSGPGSEVNFFYGADAERTEIWGHRFTIDVPRQRARFDGRPGRDLRIRRGGHLTTDQARVEFDLTTRLPTYIAGSRVHWKAPKTGK